MKGAERSAKVTSHHCRGTFSLCPALTQDSYCLLSTSQRIPQAHSRQLNSSPIKQFSNTFFFFCQWAALMTKEAPVWGDPSSQSGGPA